MGKRTSYAPGTFSWVDLATTDAAAAKAFYSGLFGWEMEETDGRGRAAYVNDPDGNVVELWTWDVGTHLREPPAG